MKITKRQLKQIVAEAMQMETGHSYETKHQMLQSAYGKLVEAFNMMNDVVEYEKNTGIPEYADDTLAPLAEEIDSLAKQVNDEAAAVFSMIQMQ